MEIQTFHWNTHFLESICHLMYPHVVLRHVIRHIIGLDALFNVAVLASLRWWNWHKQFPWELNQHTNTQIKPSKYICIICIYSKHFTHRNIFKTWRSLEIFSDLPLQHKRNFGQNIYHFPVGNHPPEVWYVLEPSDPNLLPAGPLANHWSGGRVTYNAALDTPGI